MKLHTRWRARLPGPQMHLRSVTGQEAPGTRSLIRLPSDVVVVVVANGAAAARRVCARATGLGEEANDGRPTTTDDDRAGDPTIQRALGRHTSDRYFF